MDAVLALPALEHLEVYNLGASGPWAEVVAKLRARGIKAGRP
jgi:hypothetical protein